MLCNSTFRIIDKPGDAILGTLRTTNDVVVLMEEIEDAAPLDPTQAYFLRNRGCSLPDLPR